MITLELNDVMPIGKFKNFPIKMLLGLSDDERFTGIGRENYLQWFNENVENYSFSDEIKSLLKNRLKIIAEEAYKSEREYKQRQWELSQPPYSNNKSHKRSSYDKVNQNVWNAGGMNTDYQEAGMSIQDMGYSGDGW